MSRGIEKAKTLSHLILLATHVLRTNHVFLINNTLFAFLIPQYSLNSCFYQRAILNPGLAPLQRTLRKNSMLPASQADAHTFLSVTVSPYEVTSVCFRGGFPIPSLET